MNSRSHVLLVEDDLDVAESLREELLRHGFTVTHAPTGAAAFQDVAEAGLVLLDLNLPDLDGREVCRRIREQSAVPMIAVTARSSEVDKVSLLNLGADDYVVKPFGIHELLARIEAVTRRATQRPVETDASEADDELSVGRLAISVKRRTVLLGGAGLELTPKEFDLLAFLASEPGTVFRREEILDAVWDANWFGSTKTVDVHVSQLRSKLGNAGWIEAVRGVGFRLTDPGDDRG